VLHVVGVDGDRGVEIADVLGPDVLLDQPVHLVGRHRRLPSGCLTDMVR
jgi:hypothetical protein